MRLAPTRHHVLSHVSACASCSLLPFSTTELLLPSSDEKMDEEKIVKRPQTLGDRAFRVASSHSHLFVCWLVHRQLLLIFLAAVSDILTHIVRDLHDKQNFPANK